MPLSLMNRFNKTESTVFIFWMLYFERIPEITTIVVPCGGPKTLPVHRFGVVIFTFSGPLGL